MTLLQHLKDCRHCENLLIEACTNYDEFEKLDSKLQDIKKNLEKYLLIDTYEATMSMNEYYYFSKLIKDPVKTIVVDCGCYTGIQQIFFKNCHLYIGIDKGNYFSPIIQNSQFIQGQIEDILPKLSIDKKYRYVGLSNLCCSYFKGNALKEFKNKFDFLISI